MIDTDIVSFLFKQDSRAEFYKAELSGAIQLISFMTIAELELWAVWRNWGTPRRKALQIYLQRYTIVFPDRELCKAWAEVSAQSRRDGKPVETADAWIAATALIFDVPLVTHNRGHYSNIRNLRLVSSAV